MDFLSPVQILILGLVGSGVTVLSTWAAARFRGWSPSRPLVVYLVVFAWAEVMCCGLWGVKGYDASLWLYPLMGPLGFCWLLVYETVYKKLQGERERQNWGHNSWLVAGLVLLAAAVWVSGGAIGS